MAAGKRKRAHKVSKGINAGARRSKMSEGWKVLNGKGLMDNGSFKKRRGEFNCD